MNVYQIPKITHKLPVDASWKKMPWLEIQPLYVDQCTWEKPDHIPVVQTKLAYDTDALYVIFKVEDRFVRAVAEHYQGEVYKDSCVEFFFTPGEDHHRGYFNLEINCGGTVLFHHQKGRRIEDMPVSTTDFEQVQIAHTMPKIVNPEIAEAVTWVVEYCLPISILSTYTSLNPPSQGINWRANFYKCADDSSHPHWLTWSPVITPTPDFHRPEFFGCLVFT